jgi:hypothetical protein
MAMGLEKVVALEAEQIHPIAKALGRCSTVGTAAADWNLSTPRQCSDINSDTPSANSMKGRFRIRSRGLDVRPHTTCNFSWIVGVRWLPS